MLDVVSWHPATQFLLVYALGVSAALVWQIRRSGDRSWGEEELRRLSGKVSTDATRVDAAFKVADLELRRIPWHQRSVSALGVLTFLSMSVAAGLQTVSARVEKANADSLRAEIAQMAKSRQTAERIIARAAEDLIVRTFSPGELDQSDADVLRFRREMLRKGRKTPNRVKEEYAIAMALGEYPTAVALVHANQKLFEEASNVDRLALAEAAYFDGRKPEAQRYLTRVKEEGRGLKASHKARIVVLSCVLAGKIENADVVQFAGATRSTHDDAKRQLDRAVQQFKRAGRRR
jgi:hypothetical protein